MNENSTYHSDLLKEEQEKIHLDLYQYVASPFGHLTELAKKLDDLSIDTGNGDIKRCIGMLRRRLNDVLFVSRRLTDMAKKVDECEMAFAALIEAQNSSKEQIDEYKESSDEYNRWARLDYELLLVLCSVVLEHTAYILNCAPKANGQDEIKSFAKLVNLGFYNRLWPTLQIFFDNNYYQILTLRLFVHILRNKYVAHEKTRVDKGRKRMVGGISFNLCLGTEYEDEDEKKKAKHLVFEPYSRLTQNREWPFHEKRSIPEILAYLWLTTSKHRTREDDQEIISLVHGHGVEGLNFTRIVELTCDLVLKSTVFVEKHLSSRSAL